jgi:hypothetical protein
MTVKRARFSKLKDMAERMKKVLEQQALELEKTVYAIKNMEEMKKKNPIVKRED